jgi:hypothetical protein
MEYILSERLALVGSVQRSLQRERRVLNPIWRWTGSISIQDTGEQRRFLREAGFDLAPEIVSNDRDELLGWQKRLPGWKAVATPGQLSGVDGLLPEVATLDRGIPFLSRRYLARRPSQDLRVLIVLFGRVYDVPLTQDDDSIRVVRLDAHSAIARKGVLLSRILETEVCEILLEGNGRSTRAMALTRTLGLLTPLSQLPYILEQLTTILSEELQ